LGLQVLIRCAMFDPPQLQKPLNFIREWRNCSKKQWERRGEKASRRQKLFHQRRKGGTKPGVLFSNREFYIFFGTFQGRRVSIERKGTG